MLSDDHPSARKYQELGVGYHWKALKRENSSYRRHLLVCMEALPNDPGATLLDFGCGTGVLASMCLNRGFVVTGFDPYAPAIKEATRRVPGVAFTSASPLGTWDYVISYNVAEHMEDVMPLIEMARSARKLAIVQVATPGHDAAAVPTWTPDAYDAFLAAISADRQIMTLADRVKETSWLIRP